MSRKRTPNAKDILPKNLLSELQKHSSGLLYIPPIETPAQRHRVQVRQLHAKGLHPSEIAGKIHLSERQVRNIIKRINADSQPDHPHVCDALKSIPPGVLQRVQRYAVGLLYIPPRSSLTARRHARIQRLLKQNVSIAEISRRVGLSEHHIRRLKKAWQTDDNDRFDTIPSNPNPAPEPEALSICPRCNRAVVSQGRYCDVCKNLDGFENGSVYVPSEFPFTLLD